MGLRDMKRYSGSRRLFHCTAIPGAVKAWLRWIRTQKLRLMDLGICKNGRYFHYVKAEIAEEGCAT